jgi:hypothetical protein
MVSFLPRKLATPIPCCPKFSEIDLDIASNKWSFLTGLYVVLAVLSSESSGVTMVNRNQRHLKRIFEKKTKNP